MDRIIAGFPGCFRSCRMQSGKPFSSIRVILSMGMLLGWFVSPTLASDSFENEIRPLL